MKRTLYYLILIIAVGSLIVSFWVRQKYFQVDEPVVLSFLVEKGDMEEIVKVRGEVVSKQEYDLGFSYSGKVSEIFVKEGQDVSKGDPLIKLKTTDFELENKKFKAQLDQASANVQAARATLKQYNALLSQEQSKFAELKKGTRTEDDYRYRDHFF